MIYTFLHLSFCHVNNRHIHYRTPYLGFSIAENIFVYLIVRQQAGTEVAMKLYYAPRTRSFRVISMLEELGIP